MYFRCHELLTIFYLYSKRLLRMKFKYNAKIRVNYEEYIKALISGVFRFSNLEKKIFWHSDAPIYICTLLSSKISELYLNFFYFLVFLFYPEIFELVSELIFGRLIVLLSRLLIGVWQFKYFNLEYFSYG